MSIHNASFYSMDNSKPGLFLFPSFKYIPYLGPAQIPALAQLLGQAPSTQHPLNTTSKVTTISTHSTTTNASPSNPSKPQRTRNRKDSFQLEIIPVRDFTILICGHAFRDIRCGVYGHVLEQEFRDKLERTGLKTRQTRCVSAKSKGDNAHVAVVSHVGGHAFAGNVIIYVPPTAFDAMEMPHPLRGCGVWYGRVNPRDVEGIVRETILGGRIIESLFRGGINAERKTM
jgi:hypothetical protein